jgi:predicted flap endonuclease-1-like 5' DNA nuclease
MTFTGLTYLIGQFAFVWLLVALAGGLVWGWWTCSASKDGGGWFGPGFWTWIVLLGIGALVAALRLVPGDAGLWFDTAVLFATTYFVGCCLGCWIRKLLGAEPRAVAAAAGVVASPALARAATPATAAEAAPRPAPAPAAAVPVAAAPVTPATVSPYLWQAEKAEGRVRLTGYVPGNDARSQIVDAAKRTFGSASVEDGLRTAGGAPERLALMAGASFGHLAKLDKGVASLVDNRYTLTGATGSAQIREAVLAAVRTLPAGFALASADIVGPVEAPRAAPSFAAPPAATQPSQPEPIVADAGAPPDSPAMAATPLMAAAASAEPAATAAGAAPREPGRPASLAAPRGGKPDDLKRIRGIGKQNEGRLHGLGIWHFDQIASWTPEEVAWVGAYLAFPGRIEREDWVAQGAVLARGEETAFSQRVARGEIATSRDDGSGGQGNVEIVDDSARPAGLPAPREGRADDLKLINGIGRGIEARLHALGLWHFDQIAALSDAGIAWVSNHVGFPGRGLRENWRGEAAILAAGGETDHSRAVKAGKIKSSLDDQG